MKLKELKHNHSLTDLLKILIFAILMLAPIGAVATRCMYVVCNKNAYQSYSGRNQNNIETTYIHDKSNLVTNDTYIYNSDNYDPSTITGIDFYLSSQRIVLEVQEILYNPNNFQISNIISMSFYKTTNGNNYYIYAYDEDNTTILNGQTSTSANIILKFKYTSNNLPNSNIFEYTNCFYKETYLNKNYLDNVFEYSVNELENSQLFNWTENTAIYTGVKAMTTQLEITGNVIPILITYWFLLTVIYVIIDIILKLFTVLTHMIGSKQA